MSETARARSWLWRAVGGKFGYLLIALIALMLTAPLIVDGWGWNLVLGLFASAVLVAALQVARPGRRSLAIGLVLAVVDLGIGRLVVMEGGRWLVVVQAVLWLSTLLYVTLTILGAVFERKSVGVETLQAALSVYLLLGLIWVYIYAILALVAPDSFRFHGAPMTAWSDDPSRRTELLRLFLFSYSTLTSAKYDDLTTSGGFANICACLEALSGQVYLAVVVARLVGMRIDEARREREATAGAEAHARPLSSEPS